MENKIQAKKNIKEYLIFAKQEAQKAEHYNMIDTNETSEIIKLIDELNNYLASI